MKRTPFCDQQGGKLHLSNRGQLELLRGMMERGVPFRTTVRGFSMSPFIRDEDVLTIAPMNGRAPRVGEIVAFVLPDKGRLTVHRVIACDAGGWRVGGDNCTTADGVVTRKDILGQVVRVERRGRNVHLGLGVERRFIAALNRGGHLARLGKLWWSTRATWRFVRRFAQALPLYRACIRRRRS